MRIRAILALILMSAAGASVSPCQTAKTTIEQMPVQLETRYALSALPPALRGQATVYLLDPGKGYYVARQGTSGVSCLVERTAWELADFRDDLYIPLCYDRAGTGTYLRVIMDAAALRARGMSAPALKAEMVGRFETKTYRAPGRSGVSYMVAPIFRTVGPPDLKVHTMAMPHLMFYAPNVTNADLGAAPDLAVPSSLQYPFIDKQGIAEQSYMIQLIGEADKARILADERTLVQDLCAYRDVLCLPATKQ